MVSDGLVAGEWYLVDNLFAHWFLYASLRSWSCCQRHLVRQDFVKEMCRKAWGADGEFKSFHQPPFQKDLAKKVYNLCGKVLAANGGLQSFRHTSAIPSPRQGHRTCLFPSRCALQRWFLACNGVATRMSGRLSSIVRSGWPWQRSATASHGLQIVLPVRQGRRECIGRPEGNAVGRLASMSRRCALCNQAIEIAIRCSRVFPWGSAAICLKLPRSRTCKLLSASVFLSLPLTARVGRHADTRIHAYVHV